MTGRSSPVNSACRSGPFADKDLDEVSAAVDEAFAKFEKEGISAKDLTRIKAGQETQFYNSLSSVSGQGL